MKNKLLKLVVVLGPTASGKTGLAIKMAKKFNGEIVNADSRAIYSEMKIATERPSVNEGGVRHHLVGFVAPDADFSLAGYKRLAIEKINDILARGKTPFLVGGTWLYIRSVAENLGIPEVAPHPAFRKKMEKMPVEELWRQLVEADPEAAAKLHMNDARRVIRALEVIHFSGKKISEQQKQDAPLYDILKIGVKRDLPELDRRIRLRIKLQMKRGLMAETGRLIKKYSLKLPSMSGFGYPEVTAFLRGEVDKDEALETLAKNTRQFARYQLNTFRQDKKIKWVQNDGEAGERIGKFLRK
jgi:tRNA dimethylallyltransferase